MLHTELTIPGARGIAEGLRERLVTDLNQNLATLSDLAAAYKQAHWNVTGAHFGQLHALFDQFHGQIGDYVDTIAERARALGGIVHGTIQAAVEHSALPPFPLDECDQQRLVEELVLRTDRTVSGLRQAMDASATEPATQDVYIEVVRGIEKQRWMLQSHLAVTS